jgi:hypothetical protein
MLGVIGRALLVGLAVLLGIAAAIGAFFGTAVITDQRALFTLAGLATLVLVTFGGLALATRGLPPRHGAPFVCWLPARRSLPSR